MLNISNDAKHIVVFFFVQLVLFNGVTAKWLEAGRAAPSAPP